MDPQAQRPVSFFAMVTDKRKAEKAKACLDYWRSNHRERKDHKIGGE
jgi:hypothetical protein